VSHFDYEAAKRYRVAAGFKHEHVALATNRSTGAVFAWESGRMQPRMPIIVRLAELYGVELDDLIVRDDDDERMEIIRAACVASRRAQGLPDQIDDDELADAAALLSRVK
jgi:transcriptional regulator with XRE-family HTH domain